MSPAAKVLMPFSVLISIGLIVLVASRRAPISWFVVAFIGFGLIRAVAFWSRSRRS